MSARLVFSDPTAVQDVLVFAARAGALTETALRLQARAGVLVVTAAPLAPRGLFDQTPTVLALRMSRVDPELECDLVVPASSLLAAPDDPRAIVLPEAAVTAPWAGVSPPRSGWSDGGRVGADTLAARAQWGIAAVAHALPPAPGEEIVRTVRASIWSEVDDQLAGLPRGVAFAAMTMGFIGGAEEVPIRRAGPWTRLTLARGHVLVRGPVRAGLTSVRETGAAPDS